MTAHVLSVPKWTPGPWMVGGALQGCGPRYLLVILRYDADKNRDETIATVCMTWKTGLAARIYLIAAAPTCMRRWKWQSVLDVDGRFRHAGHQRRLRKHGGKMTSKHQRATRPSRRYRRVFDSWPATAKHALARLRQTRENSIRRKFKVAAEDVCMHRL